MTADGGVIIIRLEVETNGKISVRHEICLHHHTRIPYIIEHNQHDMYIHYALDNNWTII